MDHEAMGGEFDRHWSQGDPLAPVWSALGWVLFVIARLLVLTARLIRRVF